MKKALIILAAFLGIAMAACSDNDDNLYSQLPQRVSEFISQYFPGRTISAYEPGTAESTVVVKNGPTIVFDKAGTWESVDGNGQVLPQVLLFDQLPPAVYEYLQDTNNIDNVFAISRDAKDYKVQMLESTIVYDIAKGVIAG